MGGEDGFLADVGVEEETGIRQHQRETIEPPERGGRGIQQGPEITVKI